MDDPVEEVLLLRVTVLSSDGPLLLQIRLSLVCHDGYNYQEQADMDLRVKPDSNLADQLEQTIQKEEDAYRCTGN